MIEARLENHPKDLEDLKIELSNLYSDPLDDEKYTQEYPQKDLSSVRQRKPKKTNLFRKPLTSWDQVSMVVTDYIKKLISVLGKL